MQEFAIKTVFLFQSPKIQSVALNGQGHAKTCPMPYTNNKGADQPAHPRSLISAFVVRCLDSIIPLVSIFDFKSLASFLS